MADPLGAIEELHFEGKQVEQDVVSIVTDVSVNYTIEGASTLTVAMHDDKNHMLQSGIFSARVTAQVDEFSGELVQVRKTGTSITATFEELPIAALRRHDAPKKIAANTMTHVEFARSLVREEPWITFKTAPIAQPKAKVELARGQVATDNAEAQREDTWAALGRIADERGWRRFVRNDQVWYVPETWLLEQGVDATIRENTGGVSEIDFDFDIGKRAATASVKAMTTRWSVPIGTVIAIADMGPANGKWLVTGISRSLFSHGTTVTLTRARPVLPEPEPPPAPTSDELGADGGGGTQVDKLVNEGAVSSEGYTWPLRGRISSGFGQRNGRLHAGLDIAVSTGTTVGATSDGTVTFAGTAGGYGYAVYINHGGTISRYGHLSQISVRRGVKVSRGQKIGLSGGQPGHPGAGNSTGPHLHFEIRPGDRPVDPLKYLP